MVRRVLESTLHTSDSLHEQREGNVWRVQMLENFADIEAFFVAKARAYGHGSHDTVENNARFLSLPKEKGVLFGIKRGNSVIAGAELQLMRRKGVSCGYEWNKFVVPEFQGKSLAGLVDQAVYARAKAEGCSYVFALVKRHDKRAEASIIKSGFSLNHESAFADLRHMFPQDDIYVRELH